MKSKIDLEKFICSLMKRYYEIHNIDPLTTRCWLDKVLEDQDLEYKDGEIVEISQEGEDERIIKALKEGFKYHQLFNPTFGGIPCTEIVNWLENQGKQKPFNYENSNIQQKDFAPKFDFKVGQWIVATGKCIYLIVKIDGFNVTLVDTNGDKYVFDVSSLDDAHEWSIQDAKDGDTLVTYDIRDNMEWIFLYRPNKHKLHINDPRFYCHYDLKSDSFKKDNDYVSVALGTKFRPAIKEQRDILFEKMKEARYEWDAEKKKLRKIK